MARARMTPWKLLLDPRTKQNLRLRSAAHGVYRSVFVRSLINGERPGSEPGSLAAMADAWWDSRSPGRRIAIYRNHVSSLVDTDDPADQPSIFDAEETP